MNKTLNTVRSQTRQCNMSYFWAVLQPAFVCLSVVKLRTRRLLSFQIWIECFVSTKIRKMTDLSIEWAFKGTLRQENVRMSWGGVSSHFPKLLDYVALYNKRDVALSNNGPSHFILRWAVALCNNSCRTE